MPNSKLKPRFCILLESSGLSLAHLAYLHIGSSPTGYNAQCCLYYEVKQYVHLELSTQLFQAQKF